MVKSEKNERVMAVGFPTYVNVRKSNNRGLTCTKLGEVSEYLPKPMQSGYQIGYNIMSG
ncbi:MAG: hypothetical protein F6K54_22490 [Okeania sp. SIO3B5]|uniref:hypothetical protein n=1 Tax=Okeania sp. SIO3B5 TaxID=2607811 RepID=UPI0013FE67D0|nr:hypothetical protein [Okeania sp. SIO3B5]NEO55597.1 hypothetical protein [Okeania sp. SIO3B5]